MRIGRLNQRVIVERPVNVQETDGSNTVTWQSVATVWGWVAPLKGRERLIANQTLADSDTRIRIRRDPPVYDIDTTWRMRLGSVVYNIISISNLDLSDRELEIMCVSGMNDG
jgi:SPP1 family predicted phage head-tail adaptor